MSNRLNTAMDYADLDGLREGKSLGVNEIRSATSLATTIAALPLAERLLTSLSPQAIFEKKLSR